MSTDDTQDFTGALFSGAALVAFFAAALVVLDGETPIGITYFWPEVLQPIFPEVRAGGALAALLGLYFWIGASGNGATRLALVAGGGAFLLLALPESFSPWRFWPAVFFPWLMASLERSLLTRFAVAAAWIFCDSSGVFLVVFFVAIAGAELAAGEGAKARENLILALGMLLFSPLHWPFILSSLEAYSSGASLQLAVLGWQGPKFQDEPRLVLAVLVFFGGLALSGGARREERTAVLAVFLVALFQRRVSGMFIECAAWSIALGVDRLAAKRGLCRSGVQGAMRRAALFGALGSAAVLFMWTPDPLSLQAEASVFTALKRHEGTLHGQNTQLRLFHELSFAESLRGFELNTFVEPDWNESLSARGKLREHTAAFEDYHSIMALTERWPEIFAKERFNAALIDRERPLAGVLIEREKWRVLAAGGGDGATLVLVPPGSPAPFNS